MKLRFGLLAGLLCLTMGCGSYSSSSPSAPTPAPAPAGGGGGTPVSIVRGAESLSARAYNPNPVTVAAGTTLTWTNSDSVAHTSSADDSSWNSGTIAPGASFSRAFPSSGTFSYHCTIHPGMVGTVVVQ